MPVSAKLHHVDVINLHKEVTLGNMVSINVF